MDALLGIVGFVGHAIEAVLGYVETHHWIFGLLALGYIFYLHDRALHARFDALSIQAFTWSRAGGARNRH
jgi:hypothetical protein